MFFEPNPLSANPIKWLNTLKQFVGTLHILMHIRLYGRVSDKNFFSRSISGKKTSFFFQSHIVRLEGLHGKANWNQVIINFTLFEITTKKSLHSSDTHLQTSSGRFSWKLHCSCGLWLKVIQALDIRGKKQFKKCLFFRSRSSYGPLVWMYHSWTLNNKINKLHKRCLKLIYKDNYSIFD